VFECPSVEAVVRGVEPALGEPGDIALFKRAGANGLKRAVPVERFFRSLQPVRTSAPSEHTTYLCPPLVRAIADRLGVDGLVIFEAGADMGLRTAVGALHTGSNLVHIVNGVFGGHGGRVKGLIDELELVMRDVWEDQRRDDRRGANSVEGTH
jgi:hypothetical protein